MPKRMSRCGLKTNHSRNGLQHSDSTHLTECDVAVVSKLISIVELTTVILALAGIAAIWLVPEQAKDLWLVIGPIISSVLTQLLSGRYYKAKMQNNL